MVEIFIKKGFPPDAARKGVVFMPMAFGREIVNELRVETSDEFECVQKKGIFTDKQIRKLVNDVKVYRESFKMASAMSDEDKSDETFLAVAYRSAEVNAVNQLKAHGSQPHNIVLTRMLTMWEIVEEPQSITEPVKTDNAESIKTKNWWEFWK